MDANVIDVKHNISHMSPDARYKAKFVKMVRQACLQFNMLPLKYKTNTFEHNDMLDSIENGLIKLQQFLGT